MQLAELVEMLAGGMARSNIISFGVAPKEGRAASDYGTVAIRTSELAMFDIDGLVDFPSAAALWQEGQPPEG